MDRLEFRNKFSGRIEQFRLEEFEMDVHLKGLSALDRAKVIDTYKILDKDKESADAFQKMTLEAQCFIVSRGLVDEHGVRIYKDDEKQAMAEEIPCRALDSLSKRILTISGMTQGTTTELVKNSEPSPNAGSPIVLQ
jgi:hypothetical protein